MAGEAVSLFDYPVDNLLPADQDANWAAVSEWKWAQ
jgi:hypothetical protein